jgi:hypothetical protein
MAEGKNSDKLQDLGTRDYKIDFEGISLHKESTKVVPLSNAGQEFMDEINCPV